MVKEEALSVATTKLTRSPNKLMWSPCNVILFTPTPCHTGYSVSAWRGGGAAPPKPPPSPPTLHILPYFQEFGYMKPAQVCFVFKFHSHFVTTVIL